MLDFDLAQLYDVETRILKQAVKRNINRFPSDFMFQLDKAELDNLKSQIVISSYEITICGIKHRIVSGPLFRGHFYKEY